MSGVIRNLGCIGSHFRDTGHLAIIDLREPRNPREIDYPQYHAACDAIASGLAKRGYKPGTRVGLLCSNRAEFLQIFYGAMRAGVVPVMMGILQPAETLAWIAQDSSIELVFCEQALRAVPKGQPTDQWFRSCDFKIFCAACWDHAKLVLGGL